jgi:hypothetical protein
MATNAVTPGASPANAHLHLNPTMAARALARFDRDRIAVTIEVLIALLDEEQGDIDLEEDDCDSCSAHDDTGGKHPNDVCGRPTGYKRVSERFSRAGSGASVCPAC